MKRKTGYILTAAVLILFLFVSGMIPTGRIATHSDHYSDREINAAVFMAKLYFRTFFKGCTLIEIDYAGDESIFEAKEWAQEYNAGKVIILTSSFQVDASGGDGSLEPNEIYQDWKWIMSSQLGMIYFHRDHGYG